MKEASELTGAEGSSVEGSQVDLPSQTQQRIHSLDALRGIAMVGGIVIHGMMGYTDPPIRFWPVNSADGSLLMTLLLFAFHAFRLQLFFWIAGFFAAMSVSKRGTATFVANRTRRILIPLAISAVTLVPLLQAMFLWGYEQRAIGPSQQLGEIYFDLPEYHTSLAVFFQEGKFIPGFMWFHLWFLWYLAWIYAIWLLMRTGIRWIPTRLRAWCKSIIESVGIHMTKRSLRGMCLQVAVLLVIVTVTAFAMKPMKLWQVDSPIKAWPEWPILIYYTIFFLIGVATYGRLDLLRHIQRMGPALLALGIIIFGPLMIYFQMFGPHESSQYRASFEWPALIVYCIYSWLMVFGCIGCFEKLFSQPSRARRFLADSSYFQYVLHLPLVIVLQMVLQPFVSSVWLAFLLVTTLCFAILSAAYVPWRAITSTRTGHRKNAS